VVSDGLATDVTKLALSTTAQERFDRLTHAEQQMVRIVQAKARAAVANTSSASEAAIAAVRELLLKSIGELGCVKAMKAADLAASCNSMPFEPALMLQIVKAWTASLRENHELMTVRRMVGLVTSKGATRPKQNRNTAFTGRTTMPELTEVDTALCTRLANIGAGCLLDPATGCLDERKLYETLGAARRSSEYAHHFVGQGSGAEKTVCTFGLGGMNDARRVAGGGESNVGHRLAGFAEVHDDSIDMRVDGFVLEPGLIELFRKLTRAEIDACTMQQAVTLPTLERQVVFEKPLLAFDYRICEQMPSCALGYKFGTALSVFLTEVLSDIADAHGDDELLQAVRSTVTPQYAGAMISCAAGGNGLAAGMQMSPFLTCCGVVILDLMPGRTHETAHLGLRTPDVLLCERAAGPSIDPKALPRLLPEPTDRLAKFSLSKLLGRLSGLPSKMTLAEYRSIIDAIDSKEAARRGSRSISLAPSLPPFLPPLSLFATA
jgi:hypothetical protein